MTRLLGKGLMASLALLLLASPATAEVVQFVGTTSGGVGTQGSLLTGQNFTLELSYTPNSGSATADIVGGSLVIGSQTFNWLAAGNRSMTVVDGATQSWNDANQDGVKIDQFFSLGGLPNDPNTVLPINAIRLDATVRGNTSVSLTASAANLSALLQHPNSFSGLFRVYDLAGNSVQLNGVVAAPEPGSIALLSGLALVSGRRMWRRRQQKKAAAENAA